LRSDHDSRRPIHDRIALLHAIPHLLRITCLQLDRSPRSRGKRGQLYWPPTSGGPSISRGPGSVLLTTSLIQAAPSHVGLVRSAQRAGSHHSLDCLPDDPIHKRLRASSSWGYTPSRQLGRPASSFTTRRAAGSLHGQWRLSVRPASSCALPSKLHFGLEDALLALAQRPLLARFASGHIDDNATPPSLSTRKRAFDQDRHAAASLRISFSKGLQLPSLSAGPTHPIGGSPLGGCQLPPTVADPR